MTNEAVSTSASVSLELPPKKGEASASNGANCLSIMSTYSFARWAFVATSVVARTEWISGWALPMKVSTKKLILARFRAAVVSLLAFPTAVGCGYFMSERGGYLRECPGRGLSDSLSDL